MEAGQRRSQQGLGSQRRKQQQSSRRAMLPPAAKGLRPLRARLFQQTPLLQAPRRQTPLLQAPRQQEPPLQAPLPKGMTRSLPHRRASHCLRIRRDLQSWPSPGYWNFQKVARRRKALARPLRILRAHSVGLLQQGLPASQRQAFRCEDRALHWEGSFRIVPESAVEPERPERCHPSQGCCRRCVGPKLGWVPMSRGLRLMRPPSRDELSAPTQSGSAESPTAAAG